MSREVEYKRGAVIFFEGETGQVMYLLRSGAVAVRQHERQAERAGRKIYGPGDVVGAIEALGGGPRLFTAYAEEDVKAVELTASDLRGLLEKDWSIGSKIVRALSEELRFLDHAIQNKLGIVHAPSLEGLLTIGEHFMSKGMVTSAKEAFDHYLEAAQTGAERVRALKKLAEVYQRDGDFQTALKTLKSAQAESPDDASIKKEVDRLEMFVSSFGSRGAS